MLSITRLRYKQKDRHEAGQGLKMPGTPKREIFRATERNELRNDKRTIVKVLTAVRLFLFIRRSVSFYSLYFLFSYCAHERYAVSNALFLRSLLVFLLHPAVRDVRIKPTKYPISPCDKHSVIKLRQGPAHAR